MKLVPPAGNVRSLSVSHINQTSIRIMWEEVDCVQRNGRIIEYIVIISNNSNTYNLTSTERYITVNDLVLGGIYNISVAAVNSIGSGPLINVLDVLIGIGILHNLLISHNYCYLVPSSVGSLNSIMDITWAVILWTVPSYIPVFYPIITYEIGYHVLDNCSYVDINSQLIIFSNISNVSTFTNITDLRANTCYLFGVRAYTIKYGLWTVTAKTTLTITDTTTGINSFYC